MEERWKKVCFESHNCTEDVFWEAVQIWNKSPNLINKRVFGAKLYYLGEHSDMTLFYQLLNNVYKETSAFAYAFLTHKIRCNLHSAESPYGNGDKGIMINNLRYKLFVKIILHKKEDIDGFELVLYDYVKKAATFVEPIARNTFYVIRYKEDQVTLKVSPISTMNIEWYQEVLLPKIVKWMSNQAGSHNSSIALVPIDKYKSVYNTLKAKYSSDIWKIWTEVTNPEKFIHEDLAIATYLLLLWRDKPPQRFVDLGCGNGLLVHILNGESHLGVGYDLRARKIWEKYPSTTNLKVMKIEPTRGKMFEEVDWVIGNHSDELTPWIPVIATFNSPDCNFFLLPCCAYHFDGTKFKRRQTSKSLYRDYLDYVEKICVACGFNVERDKLRIPSTKRVCFVSQGRYHEVDRMQEFKDSIDSLVEESSSRVENKNGDWNIQVKLRDSEEKVRNCTQIDSMLKQNIVTLLTDILLRDTTPDGTWNRGNPTPLRMLATHIPAKLLKQLKNEGKGLQTFIKNHHHIFKLENGSLCFRKPEACTTQTNHWKTKQCWFYHHHPDSCPLQDEQCSYIHV